MEPVQNSGGAFTPPAGYFQGVREICDRYGILLAADEVITGFGRVGDWFASERYDIRPDLITSAKGLSSAYASIGAVIATDEVAAPFLEAGAGNTFTHGITFGGHPVQAAIALANIEVMKRERIVEHVAANEQALPRHARAAPRPPDRGRPQGRRLLLGDRAREGQGDAPDLHAPGVRDVPARLPLEPLLREGPDLPRRRPRRPGRPDLAAADRRASRSSTRSPASSATCSRRPGTA